MTGWSNSTAPQRVLRPQAPSGGLQGGAVGVAATLASADGIVRGERAQQAWTALLRVISNHEEDWHRGVQAAPPGRRVHSQRVPHWATEEILRRTTTSTATATTATPWTSLCGTGAGAQVPPSVRAARAARPMEGHGCS
jgi:hypothetical protein